MHRNKGFTILELLMTIIIVSIVASIALPSFLSVIERNQLSSQANSFIGAVSMARSEAAKRGATMSLISNSTTSNWSSGWCLTPGATNCTGTVTHKYPPTAGGLVLSGNRSMFSFDARGYLSTSSGTLTLCKSSGKEGQQITINAAGRANGQRITCP